MAARMASARKSPEQRSPKSLDRQAIEQKALEYLDRFDASASRLRRVLQQFVRKRAKELGVDISPYALIVEQVLTRYRASGLLDDRRYAANLARSMVERGYSLQALRAKLSGRGVEPEIVEAVVSELGTTVGTELDAARALVRKRRLGNYRPSNERRQNLRRDLGVLARAGFDFDTAKAALSVQDVSDDEDVF